MSKLINLYTLNLQRMLQERGEGRGGEKKGRTKDPKTVSFEILLTY